MKYRLLLLVSLSCFSHITFAHSKTGSNTSINDIEVIEVTAQKRVQTLHEVPLALSVYSEEEITSNRLVNIADIAAFTPSFSMGQFNIGQPQLYIRGIGSNEDGAGGDNSVAVFVDGVYLGRSSATIFDFYDISRVEVLRGPQGTLYGKNVIGGVVNIISNQANEITDNKLQLTLGEDNHYQIRGLTSASLNDAGTLFGKLALLKTEQDGYIKSIHDFKLNGKNDTGARGQLYFEHGENFNFSLNFDWLEQRQSGAGRHPNSGELGNKVLPAINAEWAADIFTSFADVKGFQDKTLSGFHLTANWRTNWGEWKLISAKREDKYAFLNDEFALSPKEYFLDILNGGEETADQTSHELQLSYHQNPAWNWVFGAYFLKSKIERFEYFAANIIPTGSSDQHNETTSNAVFTHLIYSINDRFKLTVGARNTWEKKVINQTGNSGFVISENYDVQDQNKWQQFSPKASLGYQPNDRTLAYMSYSKGFKSGGYQGQAPTAIAAQTPFNEEIAINYELGIKQRFANNRSWFHLSYFESDYRDMQILELFQQPGQAIGVLITQNAARAKSKGVELEADLSLTSNLTLKTSYSYLDAKFTEFYRDRQDSRKGNFLRNAPRHTAALQLSYYQPLGPGAELNWRYRHQYQSKRYQEPANLEDASIPAYDVGHFSVSYLPNNADWYVSAWIDNCWNEKYFLHNFPIGEITNPATPAPPRRIGATFSFIF